MNNIAWSEDNRHFAAFSKVLAAESAKVIKKYFRTDVSIQEKRDSSPVTIADLKSEEIMRNLIMKEFPDHGIHGEEFGKHNPEANFIWMLDPIDGTKSFISGTPLFGTLIALLKNGEPLMGALNMPVSGDFLIGDNKKCLLNDKAVHFRGCDKIATATLLTTDHLNVHRYQNGEKFERLIRSVRLYRTWGDCYGYYLLATGFADIMLDPVMSPWDSMAIIPIIRGAGGSITDFQGRDPVKNSQNIVAASNKLHPLVMQFLLQ